jgi:putative FmdB family regulatory protein
MPMFEYLCNDCGKQNELLLVFSDDVPECKSCGSRNLEKIMSAPSSLTGSSPSAFPGPGDTTCCGSNPSNAGCAGPGSCCGKNFAA